ncbi:MAG: transglycosylase domain-containing protein, partial [Syntrophomonadaceae bacterium]|nr:transglycosylase domain-containing protein [Syntrophomonadaceae bacterium]
MMSRWLALKLTSLLMAVFALCFVAGAGLRGALAGAMRMDLDQFAYRPASETTLYSADGEVLLQYGYRREYRADFPPLLKQTVVAMEDQRFYQHPGIDPRGILRALYVDVRLGYKAQGGSTITQQLARTLFLNNRKSILRKTEEMLIAAVLEQRFTKDEILNMYLNEVYMGRGVCGMGAAARCYFGKTPEELSPAEISYLVAMIPAPERLSPDHDAVALKKRQATVLRVMDENGLITFREADRALQQELAVRPPRARTMRHPYFT